MSALYGEAATGGAIHIYTRTGAGLSGPNASISYGSRNTTDMSVGYGINHNGLKAGITVQRFDTDGYSAMNAQQTPTVNPDKDGYTRDGVFLNLEKSVNPDLTLGFQANQIKSFVEYDNSGSAS